MVSENIDKEYTSESDNEKEIIEEVQEEEKDQNKLDEQ